MKKWLFSVVTVALFGAIFGSLHDVEAGSVDVKTLYKITAKKVVLKKGKAGKAGFRIVLTKLATKVHPQAPFRCKVSATSGISVKKTQLGHKDKKISKDMKEVSVDVGVVASKSGNVVMDCSFFVCTKNICARTEEQVKIKASLAKK